MEYQNNSQKKFPFLPTVIITTIIVISIIGYYLSDYSNRVKNSKYEEVYNFGLKKNEQVENWLKRRLNEVNLVTSSVFLNQTLMEYFNNPTSNLKASLTMRFESLVNDSVFSDIILLDENNNVHISFDEELGHIDSLTISNINKVKKMKEIYLSDVYYCQTHNQLHVDFIYPLFLGTPEPRAILIYRINPNQYLFPILYSNASNYLTEESFLIKKVGMKKVKILSDLKRAFVSQAGFVVEVSEDIKSPIKFAADGVRGVTTAFDYRKKDVVVNISDIKGTDWILITKIDGDELFSDFNRERRVILVVLVMFFSIVILFFSAYFFYKQRRHLAALLEKEEEFRITLGSIGDAVITTDKNGRVKFINQVAAQLTGWREDEVIGVAVEEVFKIINEETRQTVESPIHIVLKEGVVVGLANHTLLISKDGKEIPIADSGAPIKDKNGVVVGVVLVFRDKTEEHIAQKKITENEFRLRQAESISNSGNWEIDLDTMRVISSEGAKRVYGIDKPELDLTDAMEFTLPEYRERINNSLRNMVENGENYEEEFKIRNGKTGEIRDIYSIAKYDEKNKKVFGVLQDITNIKKIQYEAEEQNRILATLIKNSPGLVYRCKNDKDWTIIFISKHSKCII